MEALEHKVIKKLGRMPAAFLEDVIDEIAAAAVAPALEYCPESLDEALATTRLAAYLDSRGFDKTKARKFYFDEWVGPISKALSPAVEASLVALAAVRAKQPSSYFLAKAKRDTLARVAALALLNWRYLGWDKYCAKDGVRQSGLALVDELEG